MSMYERIKRWYLQGLWNDSMVICAVEKGVLTIEQGQNIRKEAQA